jgi:hypothetical protein
LGGLELRYGVPSHVIRRVNFMTSGELTPYITLRIPVAHGGTGLVPAPAQIDRTAERAQAHRVFQVSFPGVSTQEVNYYLSATEGGNNTAEAMRLCREDLAWEAQNADLLVRREEHYKANMPKRGVMGWLTRSKSSSSMRSPSSSQVSKVGTVSSPESERFDRLGLGPESPGLELTRPNVEDAGFQRIKDLDAPLLPPPSSKYVVE